MTIKQCLLIYFAMVLSVAAYDYETTLEVIGDGELFSQTNADQVSDLAEGSGAQKYHMSLFSQSGILDLVSEYELNNTNESNENYYIKVNKNRSIGDWSKYYEPIKGHNKYSINTVIPTGFLHKISVRGASNYGGKNLSAKNHISIQPIATQKSETLPIEYAINAKYDVEGNGRVTQSFSDLKSSKHPKNVAENWAQGNFSMESSLNEDFALAADEIQELSGKTERITASATAPTETKNSSLLKDLDDLLKDGLITGKDYLAKLKNLYVGNKINYSDYVNKIFEMKEKGYIVVSDEEQSELVAGISSDALNDSRLMLKQGDITVFDFIKKIKSMLGSGRINEVKYLAEIKSLPSENITEADYNAFKVEVLNELRNKLKTNKIDQMNYLTMLTEMRDLDLINQSELDRERHESSKSALDQMNESLLQGLISEKDYIWNLNNLLNDRRIDEVEFNQLKLNILEGFEEKILSDGINWSEYESTLKKMLDAELITGDDYANFIHDVIFHQNESDKGNLTGVS